MFARGCPLLLVTGFGPFPGVRRNPSAGLAEAVARSPRWRLLGVDTRTLALATTYADLAETFAPALRGPPLPDLVLMIGVAARSKRVRIEGRATRRSNPLLPDAAGRTRDRSSGAQGPPTRRTTLPAPPVAAALARHGVPCRLSIDAGRYLCNAAYYRALAGPVPILFLHVPRPPRPGRPRRASTGKARLGWEERLARAFVAVAVDLLTRARARAPAFSRSVAAPFQRR